MITRLSHATIYVLDQDEALKFYRDKLGFEVRTDATMDSGFRWLTVSPKTQPELEIVKVTPRYYPELSWITALPGLREFLTWNCAVLLRKN